MRRKRNRCAIGIEGRGLPEVREDILPKNILIGPQEWETEIARRLARLAGAPFVKIEATKFEVAMW